MFENVLYYYYVYTKIDILVLLNITNIKLFQSFKFRFSSLTSSTLNQLIFLTVNGLSPHLFVKVPRPGDSKVTFAIFESSCHLLLPV